MESGKIHCANKVCKKVIGFFPADNAPKENVELYCETCMKVLEEQEKIGKENGKG